MLCPSPASGDALLHSWPGAVPGSVLCLALCNWCRNLALCWGRHWKVAGMEEGRGGEKSSSSPWLPASSQSSSHPSGFICSPFIWWRERPLMFLVAADGVVGGGRRARCAPPPRPAAQPSTSTSTSCPSISHWDALSAVIESGLSQLRSQSMGCQVSGCEPQAKRCC